MPKVDINEVIKRHEEKGFTRKQAITFVNKVTLMVVKGLLTKDEAEDLLRTGTIDCIG